MSSKIDALSTAKEMNRLLSESELAAIRTHLKKLTPEQLKKLVKASKMLLSLGKSLAAMDKMGEVRKNDVFELHTEMGLNPVDARRVIARVDSYKEHKLMLKEQKAAQKAAQKIAQKDAKAAKKATRKVAQKDAESKPVWY